VVETAFIKCGIFKKKTHIFFPYVFINYTFEPSLTIDLRLTIHQGRNFEKWTFFKEGQAFVCLTQAFKNIV
jgi:hypothetical protein